MMNVKRWITFALALCMLVTLTACGNSGTKVFVQSVSSLMNMGGIAPGDRLFADHGKGILVDPCEHLGDGPYGQLWVGATVSTF